MDWGDPAHVKLHAPPGGKSSFSLSWGDDPEPPKRRAPPPQSQFQLHGQEEVKKPFGAPSYPAPAPAPKTFGVPSTGGMRTENNIGSDGGDRSSVKVHNPPGGASSFSIFGGDEPFQHKQPFGHQHRQFQAAPPPPPPPMPSYQRPPDVPAFGERVTSGSTDVAGQGKTSVKVHAPPGGKSSITF